MPASRLRASDIKIAAAGLAPATKGFLSPWFIYEHQCSEAPSLRTSIAQVFYGSGKFAGKNVSERNY
jgi:hypothetical protein